MYIYDYYPLSGTCASNGVGSLSQIVAEYDAQTVLILQ